MKLSMSEWNLLMIYIKDKCGIKEKHKKDYGKRISKLAKDLEQRKIIETGMTKSLDMYPNIIFFEDLLNEVTKLENKIDINYTDSNKLDPYEMQMSI